MTTTDNEILKTRLEEYLHSKGVFPIGQNIRCIDPRHPDENPSASITQANRLKCHSCGYNEDIFGVCKTLTGITEFPEQLKEVQESLGEYVAPPVKKAEKTVSVPVALERDEALSRYSEKRILDLCNFVINQKLEPTDKKYKTIKIQDGGWFPYYDAEGKIDVMEVRFWVGDEKTVMSFYWNGKNIVMRGYPVVLFNRNKIVESDKPVVIHEGVKKVNECDSILSDFTHTGWNGGGKKYADIRDLELLKDREVYLFPDDDNKKDRGGHLLGRNEQPGLKTMIALKARLSKDHKIEAHIIPFFEKAREIKKDGADIEEVLKCYEPEEIKNIILGSVKDDRIPENNDCNETIENGNNEGNEIPPQDDSHNVSNNSGINSSSSDSNITDDGTTDQIKPDNKIDNKQISEYLFPDEPEKTQDQKKIKNPFKILGIAEDNRAYFLDHENRLTDCKTTSINDNFLQDLGTLQHYINIYGAIPKKDEWLREIDDVRNISKKLDFKIDDIRGYGAWRDCKGNICYHDGAKTTGTPDKNWTFIRKPKKDIGISAAPCDFPTRQEIFEICTTFNFKTKADAVRLMAWAVLSPFAGSLSWRPAILVTGDSASGKSWVSTAVISPISSAKIIDGSTSTAAGIIQGNKLDSGGIIADEAERKSKKDFERMEPIFGVVRASTHDGAPDSLKGSANGTAVTFKMRSMFCFIAIDASMDNVANDNRIIRVNFKKSGSFAEFIKNKKRITELLNDETCKGIRAFTWKNLQKIIKLGTELEHIIQLVTKNDSRFSAGESILLAANMIVWEGITDFSPEFLMEYVTEFYKEQTSEESRDENTELIDRLLDHIIEVGSSREKRSIRSVLMDMKKFLDQKYYQENQIYDKLDHDYKPDSKIYLSLKKTIELYGVSCLEADRQLVIVQNHHKIMQILEISKGYHRQLQRHENVIKTAHAVRIDGASKRGEIIGGFLDYEVEQDEEF